MPWPSSPTARSSLQESRAAAARSLSLDTCRTARSTVLRRDGKVVTRFRSGKRYSESFSVVIQPDGKIVAAGLCCGARFFALARYLPNGKLDATFGADGKVTTDLTPGSDIAYDVTLQADGKILAAGVAAKDRGAARFALVRYRRTATSTRPSAGTANHDTTVRLRLRSACGRRAVRRQDRCRRIDRVINEFALAGYLTDGSPDDTFGDGGITVSDFTDFGCAQADLEAMAIQSDGKLIATGLTACKGVNDVEFAFASARYDDDGTLDASFGQEARSRPWSGTPPASKGDRGRHPGR